MHGEHGGCFSLCFCVIVRFFFQRVGAGSLLGRFVPFVAIAAANCINIPLMRQRELKYGIPIYDDQDNRLGTSKVKKRS